jgi:L-iditol 2-dehydrogenase
VKVARLYSVGDVRIGEEADPAVPDGETLLEIASVGLCGSDLHRFGEGVLGLEALQRPLVPGHEFSGVIASGPRRGQLVAADPAQTCGRCEMCAIGDHNLCLHSRFAGAGTQDGALRELASWPTELLYPLPDHFSTADGAMLEPLTVALGALDFAHLRAGSSVTIVGGGPIGLFLVQLARASGASQVVVVEPLPHRREAALRFGADVVLDPAGTDDEAIREAAGGRGADVSFEVAGTKQAMDIALRSTRPGARVVIVGIPSNDEMAFSASLARTRGLTLYMQFRTRVTFERVISLVQRKIIDVSSMVTAHYPLDKTSDAFAVANVRAGLKVVVDPTGDL